MKRLQVGDVVGVPSRCSSVSRPPHLRRVSFGISAPSSRIKTSSKLWEIWVTCPSSSPARPRATGRL